MTSYVFGWRDIYSMKYVLLVLKRIKLKEFKMPMISYTESEFLENGTLKSATLYN